jgi:hypothetical protein
MSAEKKRKDWCAEKKLQTIGERNRFEIQCDKHSKRNKTFDKKKVLFLSLFFQPYSEFGFDT